MRTLTTWKHAPNKPQDGSISPLVKERNIRKGISRLLFMFRGKKFGGSSWVSLMSVTKIGMESWDRLIYQILVLFG